MARNTKAELALGLQISRARAEETKRLQEAFRRKKQEEKDEEERRIEEIRALGRGYEVPPEQPKAEEQAQPLPPPTEEEVQDAVRRKRAKSLPAG